MSSGIESTTYAIMAQGHSFITKGINAGKPKAAQEARADEERENEKRMVIAIYSSRGKIMEYPEDNQRYVENYREFVKRNLKHRDISA